MATRAQITEFNLQRIDQGEVQILSLNGYMGNDEFSQVDRELSRLLEQKDRRVILDLGLLSFATTMNLARLRMCGREFRRRGGELKLAGPSPWLSHLAVLAGFDRQKDFEPDVATALKAISGLLEVKAHNPPEQE